MQGLKLFTSYCHADEGFRRDLGKWLTTLRNEGHVIQWDDRKVTAGKEFEADIDRNLLGADVVLLLFSQDYVASAACQKEMQFAIANKSSKRVIPIILRPCTWKETACKQFLALPTDGVAIETWTSREEAWLDVFAGVKRAVNDILKSFDMSDEFSAEIQSVEFVTHNMRHLSLSDVFVFPNLTVQVEPDKRELLSQEDIADKDRKALLVCGDELSGKTGLLRSLCLSLRGQYSPILLDGNAIFKSVNFEQVFRREFGRQMKGSFDEWLLKNNKAVLIDDYHHKISRTIISYLTENFSKVILAVEEAEYMIHFREDPTFAGFTVANLRPLGLSKQEALIRKWMSFGRSDPELDDLEIDKTEEKVNGIISHNQIVPRFPFYILTILQSFEMFMPKDYGITAHGHCYQALLTAQLIKKGIKLDEIDSCLNYLTELAFDMYMIKKQRGKYGITDYEAFKAKYVTQYYIEKGIIRRIEDKDYPILKLEPEQTGFEYSYIYYFLLGRYLAVHGTQKDMEDICRDIHFKENAFIVIFTVHHAQKKDLLDAILRHCATSFESIPPAQLNTEETRFMQNLLSDLPKSIMSTRPVAANRREERDLALSDLAEEDEEDDKEDVHLIELTKSMRILEVLSQILKNRGGSFDKTSVLDMLKQTIDLGLRVLKLFLNDLQKPDFRTWLQGRLAVMEREAALAGRMGLTDDQRLKYVEKTIQLFGYVSTVGMLAKISHCLRSDKLVEPVSELAGKMRTPAYDIVEFLVRISQRGMDSASVRTLLKEFEGTRNHWAEMTISLQVQHYLNTHKVPFRERQRIFELLGLRYIPNA